MRKTALLFALFSTPYVVYGVVDFTTCLASDEASSFKDLNLVSRAYIPYGADKISPGAGEFGYGYGMGALERVAYDYEQHYLYGASEQGQVTVTDFSDPTNPKVLPEQYLIDIGGTLTDIQICPEKNLLFISSLTNGAGGQGDVLVYSTYQRDNVVEDAPLNIVELKATIPVGFHPDNLKPNPSCDMIAVANEGEGTYDGDLGLKDPVGSISLIDVNSMTASSISIDKWTDEELIDMGVHLPLPKKALTYWNTYSALANDLNFDEALDNYKTAQNLEPEYVAWSSDSKYVYVNLQENSAIITVDVEAKDAIDITPLGLRDWSETKIDIFKDDGCSKIMPVPNLYSAPMPDSIESVTIDGITYILTADEGDDKEYGAYEEKVKAKELFGGEVIEGVTPIDYNCSSSAEAEAVCSGSLRLTIGSSAVNYDNPSDPVIEKIVTLGGRGISILKESPSNDKLEVFWNSGSELEEAVCKNLPWAFNSVQDEEFAPVNGVLYNTTDDDLRETITEVSDPEEDGCEDQGDGTPGACPLSKTVDERSEKDGPAPEAIVAGKACGRLFAVTSSEKGGSAFLYDITNISSPVLTKVFHLSPASENLSAGLAYDRRELGEVDAESVIFLDESKSPSGKAAILFAGAWSGTVSYWEFECSENYVPKRTCNTYVESVIEFFTEIFDFGF